MHFSTSVRRSSSSLISLTSIILIFLLLFLCTPTTSKKSPFYPGSNCNGGECCRTLSPVAEEGMENIAVALTAYIDHINLTRIYTDNSEIACHDVDNLYNFGNTPQTVCAVLKTRAPMTGAQIKSWAHFIPDHGCRICGSVPMVSVEEGSVQVGELSYDCVVRHCNLPVMHSANANADDNWYWLANKWDPGQVHKPQAWHQGLCGDDGEAGRDRKERRRGVRREEEEEEEEVREW
ncbi:MAG: hypothetical protein MMC33_008416 [Icmadophila ericetorum]|nr:hypothetical protein [Icmadophila ericetorum]